MAKRIFLLTSLAYLLLIAGLATLRGAVLVLAVPVVLYLLAGLWRAPDSIELEIHHSLSRERTAPDVPVRVTLTVSNHGSALEEVFLEDSLPPGLHIRAGSNHHLLSLPTGGSFSWSYDVSGPRGFYAFLEVRAEASDRLGLIRRKKKLLLATQLLVLPPVMRIQRVAIRPRHTNVYSGTIPARLGGSGVEFFGVREYVRGDPPGWINWNISARHPGNLYSNEFEQERVADVGIVLDSRLLTNTLREGHSLFEYSIQAVAALANAFLVQGNRVGLLLYGHFLHWTFPGYGKLQRERILQTLAHAEAAESLVFSDLGHIPTQLFPTHSQIVLVSPLIPTDFDVLLQLRARGYQVMVISPDPVRFELAYLPKSHQVALAGRIIRMERIMLMNKLRHAGLQVMDWDVAQPFDRVGLAELGRPVAWIRSIGS